MCLVPLSLTLTYAPWKEMRWQKLKNEVKRDEVNMKNSVKWSRFILHENVEQINHHLFIDNYKQNKIQNGMNEMMVNDSGMSMR